MTVTIIRTDIVMLCASALVDVMFCSLEESEASMAPRQRTFTGERGTKSTLVEPALSVPLHSRYVVCQSLQSQVCLGE